MKRANFKPSDRYYHFPVSTKKPLQLNAIHNITKQAPKFRLTACFFCFGQKTNSLLLFIGSNLIKQNSLHFYIPFAPNIWVLKVKTVTQLSISFRQNTLVNMKITHNPAHLG